MAQTSQSIAAGIEEKGRRARRIVLMAGILLGLVLVLGVIVVLRFVANERDRDLIGWQVRLGIVADSRVAAIDDWLDAQYRIVRELAENPTVQLYLTELALSDGDAAGVADGEAQTGYIRNLATATAEREGFMGPRPAAPVAANIPVAANGGIAVIDPLGRLVAGTAGLPALEGPIAAALATRVPGEKSIIDAYRTAAGEVVMGFIWPVHGVQADAKAGDEIGAVIGVRPVVAELERRIIQPGETARTAESEIVRRAGDGIEYVTGLRDGTPALMRILAGNTPDLDTAFALGNPGGFAERRDYAGNAVLAVARAVKTAPWVLVRKVDTAEALAETRYRTRVLLVVFLGAIAFVGIVVVAVWRHGTSVRAAQAAEQFRDMADRFSRLFTFMRVVTDSQPTAIAAVDQQGRYTFANREAAAGTGIETEEMLGKTLAAVIGPIRAKGLEQQNRRARETGSTVVEIEAVGDDETKRILKTAHVPLPDSGDFVDGVLMVTEDITDLVNERARRERILKQLTATLVAVIDRRDPYSANHSARVAEVSRDIAEEMGLSAVEVETVEIAASVMNLGKIAVPAELLTRQGALSEEEMRLIRDSILTSADLLDGVEFDGPVVQTLRQLQEHWDGTGVPHGLSGDAILPMARIVSVANAFVGMASARAWRPGLAPEKAADALMRDVGARFDRAAVAALLNVLENRGGRARWARFGEPPRAAGV